MIEQQNNTYFTIFTFLELFVLGSWTVSLNSTKKSELRHAVCQGARTTKINWKTKNQNWSLCWANLGSASCLDTQQIVTENAKESRFFCFHNDWLNLIEEMRPMWAHHVGLPCRFMLLCDAVSEDLHLSRFLCCWLCAEHGRTNLWAILRHFRILHIWSNHPTLKPSCDSDWTRRSDETMWFAGAWNVEIPRKTVCEDVMNNKYKYLLENPKTEEPFLLRVMATR